MGLDQDIRRRFETLSPALNERTRRLWAATEAHARGYGGVSVVSEATGISRRVIAAGIRELNDPLAMASDRMRRPGGGRKSLAETDPQLLGKLDALVEPTARGDPMSPLRWTSKSVRKLAEQLTAQGHPVSHKSVANLLHEMDYSLQANRKTKAA